ncbi:hypothetical protein P9222_21235 [Paenibacillus amylolyticus]|nr:hypothetical protein [Paenibacillus amylolyticus]WFR61029.1 hypothetical protein P9222_21235 [Paenibacillus amylolyticus]
MQIEVDGQTVATITPSGSTYESFTTDWFTVEPGSHTILFSATGTGTGATFIDQVSIEKVAVPDYAALQHGGFESPTITSQNGVAVTSGDGWSFKNNAGRIRNGSVFGASDAPEGTQAAYLQTLNGKQGEFSQSLIFPAGHYAIQFQSAKRSSFGDNSPLMSTWMISCSVHLYRQAVLMPSSPRTPFSSTSRENIKFGLWQLREPGTTQLSWMIS